MPRIHSSRSSPRRPAALAAAAGLALLLAAGSASAQTSPPNQSDPSARPGCGAPQQEAATPKASGPTAGTEPGGSGSTGWSGGNGGSYVGTTPQGATPGSPTQQPETVQGLNPQPQPATPC